MYHLSRTFSIEDGCITWCNLGGFWRTNRFWLSRVFSTWRNGLEATPPEVLECFITDPDNNVCEFCTAEFLSSDWITYWHRYIYLYLYEEVYTVMPDRRPYHRFSRSVMWRKG